MNASQCEKDIKIIAVLVTFTKDAIKEKNFFYVYVFEKFLSFFCGSRNN